jgi:hypothetical protein
VLFSAQASPIPENSVSTSNQTKLFTVELFEAIRQTQRPMITTHAFAAGSHFALCGGSSQEKLGGDSLWQGVFDERELSTGDFLREN